jgi:aminoglycoside phosphotransferase (APT) family kinase protein
VADSVIIVTDRRSPAHGFADDEETRRLLRSRPPRQALAWAGARLGGPVVSARALRGGMSSAVHLVTVQHAGERRDQAVLRRYVRPGEDPALAAREARALGLAEQADVPTPALLAVDPDGTQAGVPALLMSRLPGRIDWWPSELDRWLRRLAGLLPRIHATLLPAADASGTMPRFAPYRPDSYRPPAWARYPRIWEQAVEISHGPAPTAPAVLLHRDFHPGNVLWRRGQVSGVVDWQAACAGPAAADVAHCRVNLLTLGPGVAERFTGLWEQAAGAAYHPWGDVVTIVGFLDDLRDDWGSERLLVEDMLARAVAGLGG